MITIDTTNRVFQYKFSSNVLFLNKMLYRLGIFPDLLCLTDTHLENLIITSHLLLIFKYYISISGSNKQLSFLQFKTDIIKVKNLKENLDQGDKNKRKKYHKKWQ